MSLINQMLRDLEQRNSQNPQAAEPLKVRTAAQGRRGWWFRLWLLPLIALPAAYVWHSHQGGEAARQTAASPTPSIETRQAPIAAIEPLAIAPQPQPQPQQQRQKQKQDPQDKATLSTPKALPAEPEKPAGKPEAVEKPTKPAAKPETTTPEKIITASAPLAVKIPTPRERAESLYRQAQHAASAPMIAETLQDALRLDQLYLPARTLLLQTLIKSHAADTELGAFADESLQLFPNNLLFLKTRAHLYVKQKNFNAAVGLLERIDADSVDDGAYLSLLAAGYQQLQRFPEAARLYRQLTQIQPDRAENWLGLAIALDKLNQSQAAAQAYRQALDKKTLNGEVVDYINQRLSALN